VAIDGKTSRRTDNRRTGHKAHALPQQFEIRKAHLPRRRPRLNSPSQEPPAEGQPLRCPSSSGRHRQAVRCGGEYPSNERHRASHPQAKFAAEKRWKCRFCRTILPFATETSLVDETRHASGRLRWSLKNRQRILRPGSAASLKYRDIYRFDIAALPYREHKIVSIQ
jgi:hypothetical protein